MTDVYLHAKTKVIDLCISQTHQIDNSNIVVFLFPYIYVDFSKTHKIYNIGNIAVFLFPYIHNFHLYLHHVILVNVKLDDSAKERLCFKGADFVGLVHF